MPEGSPQIQNLKTRKIILKDGRIKEAIELCLDEDPGYSLAPKSNFIGIDSVSIMHA